MSALYSIGLMNQLGDALEKAGFTAEDITKLRQLKDLSKIKDIVSKRAYLAYHYIDTDKDPEIPKGYKIFRHQPGGMFQFDKEKISIIELRATTVEDFLEKFVELKALNANVLDYLLDHFDIIPRDWYQSVFFPGTVYLTDDGYHSVRFLHYDGEEYGWSDCLLENMNSQKHYIAVYIK